jgi:hypothetical protein
VVKQQSNQYTSRFEVEPTCPFGHGLAKGISISRSPLEELRGSPSLVGRGIANPMSERTRGFEMLSSLCCFGASEREGNAKFPLPALLILPSFW